MLRPVTNLEALKREIRNARMEPDFAEALLAALDSIPILVEERDRARRANDRLAETIAAMLAELPPRLPPAPLNVQVRELASKLASTRRGIGMLQDELLELGLYREGDQLLIRGTDFHVAAADYPALARLAQP